MKDRHDTAQIGSVLEDKSHEEHKVLGSFHNMEDGHLGLTSNASHEIGLDADAKPLRSVPHRGGIRMHDIEKAKVHKIVE